MHCPSKAAKRKMAVDAVARLTATIRADRISFRNLVSFSSTYAVPTSVRKDGGDLGDALDDLADAIELAYAAELQRSSREEEEAIRLIELKIRDCAIRPEDIGAFLDDFPALPPRA